MYNNSIRKLLNEQQANQTLNLTIDDLEVTEGINIGDDLNVSDVITTKDLTATNNITASGDINGAKIKYNNEDIDTLYYKKTDTNFETGNIIATATTGNKHDFKTTEDGATKSRLQISTKSYIDPDDINNTLEEGQIFVKNSQLFIDKPSEVMNNVGNSDLYQISILANGAGGNTSGGICFKEGNTDALCSIIGYDDGPDAKMGLSFNTGDKDGIGEAMNITSQQNVGIGTNNPSYLLDVNGDINGKKLRYDGEDIDTKYIQPNTNINTGNITSTGVINADRVNAPILEFNGNNTDDRYLKKNSDITTNDITAVGNVNAINFFASGNNIDTLYLKPGTNISTNNIDCNGKIDFAPAIFIEQNGDCDLRDLSIRNIVKSTDMTIDGFISSGDGTNSFSGNIATGGNINATSYINSNNSLRVNDTDIDTLYLKPDTNISTNKITSDDITATSVLNGKHDFKTTESDDTTGSRLQISTISYTDPDDAGNTLEEGQVFVRNSQLFIDKPSEVMDHIGNHNLYQISILANGVNGSTSGGICFKEETSDALCSIIGYDDGASSRMGLTFNTGDDNGIGEAMNITADKNVGIGTSSPTARLQIEETSDQTALEIRNTGSGDCFVVEDSSHPDTTPFKIDNEGQVIIFDNIKILRDGGGLISYGDENDEGFIMNFDFLNMATNCHNRVRLFRDTETTGPCDFEIFKGDGSSTSNHVLKGKGDSFMQIDGNLGIGDTTPSYKLDVNGDINATTLRYGGTDIDTLYLKPDTDISTGTITADGDISCNTITLDHINYNIKFITQTEGNDYTLTEPYRYVIFNHADAKATRKLTLSNDIPDDTIITIIDRVVTGIDSTDKIQIRSPDENWGTDIETIEGSKTVQKKGTNFWYEIGNYSRDLNYADGNVGINTNPEYDFDVNGVINATTLQYNEEDTDVRYMKPNTDISTGNITSTGTINATTLKYDTEDTDDRYYKKADGLNLAEGFKPLTKVQTYNGTQNTVNLDSSHHLIVCNTFYGTDDLIIQLPTLNGGGPEEKEYIIKAYNTFNNNITIKAASGEQIDGQSQVQITQQWGSMRLIGWDSTSYLGWFII